MTTYFLDSSAIGKRYMTEVGSTWVRSLVAPAAGHVVVVSRLAIVEISSALARLWFAAAGITSGIVRVIS